MFKGLADAGCSDIKRIFCVLLICWSASACATDAVVDKNSCESLGGQWGRFGLVQAEQCSLPTQDAGAECSDLSDCESVCITDVATSRGTTVTGRCFDRSITLGNCLNLVLKGVAQGEICED